MLHCAWPPVICLAQVCPKIFLSLFQLMLPDFIGVVKDFCLKRNITHMINQINMLTLKAPYTNSILCEPAYTTKNSKMNHNMRILN